MRTDQLKVSLIQKILFTEDAHSLNKIKTAIEGAEKPVQLSATLKTVLKKSMKSLKEGKKISQEDVFRKIDKWLNER